MDHTPPATDPLLGQASSTLVAQAARLGVALRGRGACVVTAESCTGGLISAALTAVPGSSDYYLGGVVTYANALKVRLLDVDPALIAAEGAVSAAVARAMAVGARARLPPDDGSGTVWAMAVTGIAGPGGGSAEKPVGTVFVALAGPDGPLVLQPPLSGDRAAIRAGAAQIALGWLAAMLSRPD